MNKQESIRYISGLLNDSSLLADSDANSIAGLRQSYPYFVPARYLDAHVRNRSAPLGPAMLTSVTPYLGNWILFCDFVSGKGNVAEPTAVKEMPVEDAVLSATMEPRESENEENGDEQAEPDVAPVGAAKSVVDAVMSKEEAQPQHPDDQLDKLHEDFWFQEDEEKVQDEGDIEVAITETGAEHTEKTIAGSADEDFETASEPEELSDVEVAPVDTADAKPDKDKPLISPVYIDDYFLQQGERISTEMPQEIESLLPPEDEMEAAKSLMVMMSFSEWLLHFKNTAEKQREETRDQKALKTMWQKEKLAAAIEEENEEIPENVFEMAVNSIAKEDGLASEPLAAIFIKQGKPDKAIEIYRKLSLRNPQKSAFFALKIEEILKEKKS